MLEECLSILGVAANDSIKNKILTSLRLHGNEFWLVSLLESLIIERLSIFIDFWRLIFIAPRKEELWIPNLVVIKLLAFGNVLCKSLQLEVIVDGADKTVCKCCWCFRRFVQVIKMQNNNNMNNKVPIPKSTISNIFKLTWHLEPAYQAKHSQTIRSGPSFVSEFVEVETVHLP